MASFLVFRNIWIKSRSFRLRDSVPKICYNRKVFYLKKGMW